MKTKENINTDNYYYYQVFTNDAGCQTGVVFAGNTNDAEEKINQLLNDRKIGNSRRDISLYHKNYKRESRRMVEEGNYIE